MRYVQVSIDNFFFFAYFLSFFAQHFTEEDEPQELGLRHFRDIYPRFPRIEASFHSNQLKLPLHAAWDVLVYFLVL